MVKQMNLKNLKADTKKLDEMKEEIIGDYKIQVSTHIRNTKIEEALREYLNDRDAAFKSGEPIEDVMAVYMFIILIKHFTSLNVPEGVDEKIDTISALIDLGLFWDVVEVLPDECITKFLAAIDIASKSITKNLEEIATVVDELENKEIKELVEPVESKEE
ncbi:hypothetical protein [Bacillus thuringiensis]|uniref:hypothetical protein n=1 Tax=Bacillus thuringiensis TaxID=1428 RepID=UPI000BFA6D25|nr:hypothetical protein [Bacillus thuringiensis]MDO6628706.1 hypothetical protein [Bacillus thuringiensis]MDO6659169.1 hypothetical protein [Bacillus thuringiensis]MDO6698751.1 hypothetical protein [Bacillus thuringiensis]PES54505.1 hypothetical protein CN506_20755 [Bacillus thuringiensis]